MSFTLFTKLVEDVHRRFIWIDIVSAMKVVKCRIRCKVDR